MSNLSKVVRFIHIYGLKKTWLKVIGRERLKLTFFRPRKSRLGQDVGVIGCGQFTFATVGIALCKKFANRFVDCYDVADEPQQTFAEFYGIKAPSSSGDELIVNNRVKYVYISSNHATHTDYAIASLAAGKTVYIEKPVSVSYDQL